MRCGRCRTIVNRDLGGNGNGGDGGNGHGEDGGNGHGEGGGNGHGEGGGNGHGEGGGNGLTRRNGATETNGEDDVHRVRPAAGNAGRMRSQHPTPTRTWTERDSFALASVLRSLPAKRAGRFDGFPPFHRFSVLTRCLRPLRARSLRPLRARSLRPLRARSLRPLRARSLRPLRARCLRPLRWRNIPQCGTIVV
jgi:hypothetical protein